MRACTAFPQCDVYCPVVAAGFAKFGGAIEWVDDPHTVCRQTLGVVGSFFGEYGIVGAHATQGFDDEAVGECIAGIHHGPRRCVVANHLLAKLDK